LIGQAYYNMKNLAYLLDHKAQMSLFSATAEKVGMLHMNINPTDSSGEKPPEDEPTDPTEIRINQDLR